MGIGKDTFAEIQNANDIGALDRIGQFTQTGDQDESNSSARQLIAKKRGELAVKKQRDDLRTKMTGQAADYRKNIKNTQESQFGQVADTSKRGLAQKMAGIDSSANSRGLLYSGLNQGAHAAATAQHAGQLSDARSNINTQTESTANDMENRARNMGLDDVNQASKEWDNTYNQALNNKAQSAAAMGAVGGALGQVAGIAGAGMSRQPGAQQGGPANAMQTKQLGQLPASNMGTVA